MIFSDCIANAPKKDKDLAKQRRDRPRIILATSYAEVAVTIPDVQIVVDVGDAIVAHDVDGLSAVSTCRVSESSSRQRAGRAGRTQRVHLSW